MTPTQLVDLFRSKTAEIIELCQVQIDHAGTDAETLRLWSLALSTYQEALMWAIKAAATL